MTINRKFDSNDVNKMDWAEFEQLTLKVINDLKKSGVKFHAVAPILRNGMIPATIIANKLKILNIIPIQLKTDYSNNTVLRILDIQKPLNKDFPNDPNILVVDANTFSGKSAQAAYDIFSKSFPSSNLYFATITRVFRKELNALRDYKRYFFGKMSDEEFVASEEEIKEYDLREKITVFPWESIEAELGDINGG